MVDSVSFLGLDFIPLKLEHQPLIAKIFENYPQTLSPYTFAFLFAWNSIYSFEFYQFENTLFLSAYFEETNHRHLLQPIGPFEYKQQNHLISVLSKSAYPIKIFNVTQGFLEKHPDFCSRFNVLDDRNNSNYIYKTKDLAHLAGGHYEKKRNLIYQCESLYQWEINSLSECKERTLKKLLEIGLKSSTEMTESLKEEHQAIEVMISNFKKLNLKGIVIHIEKKPVAFSIYETLNPITAIIHVEKAEKQYKGLYQLINRETAKKIEEESFTFINREEDMGIEGLRKAKLSYHPYTLIQSSNLTWNNP